MELYLNDKISCKNTLDFLHSQFNNAKTNVHAVQVYKDNELVVRLAPSPYSNTHKRQVYSISKTFAATAIGIACDMGILKVTDKLSDIFTNEISFEQNSNMSELTIWHLLTMSSGHKDCCMKEISLSRDGVSTFFKKEFINTPGESYLYDTGASYMLSAVLTKLTGMSMLDFLNIHLFRHMDIHNITWKFCGGNINEGGIGLNISADDIAKLGLLYINKGIYKGKRILSEKWITDATTGYLAGDFTREPDWKSGYGYQIWRNVQGGYRADGAFGQYCIVVPDKNIIMVILVESENVEMELSLCFNYMNCMFSKNTNDISIKHIENFLNNYYIPFNSIDTIKEEKKLYKINANSNNITFAKTEKSNDLYTITLYDGEGNQTITAGNGKWIENRVRLNRFKPQLYCLMNEDRTEDCFFLASFKNEKEKFQIELRYLDCPHTVILNIYEDNKNIMVKYCANDDITPEHPFQLSGTILN